MKTGFNGIYQLNKNTNGRYGTPAGLLNQKDKVYDRGVLNWWHNALQNVTIKSGDWKDAVENDPNGFFFFDPPYRDSFADYGNGFGDEALTSLLDFADAQNFLLLLTVQMMTGLMINQGQCRFITSTLPILRDEGRKQRKDLLPKKQEKSYSTKRIGF